MEIDLTNAHPCPDCRQCLTILPKCRYCAERDQLRSTVAGLRRALDDAGDVIHACVCETEELRGKVCCPACHAITTALAASPDDHARRIKAEAAK